MSEQEPRALVEDVAPHIGVSKHTVYRWIESKALRADKVGRLWKFERSDIDEWVRAGGARDDEERR